MPLQVRAGDQAISITTFRFSGGEVQVRLGEMPKNIESFAIKCLATNSDDILELLMVANALRQATWRGIPIRLWMPYLPYARQDRACAPGEANGLEMMCGLLQHTRFEQITFWDVHNPEAVQRYLTGDWRNAQARTFMQHMPKSERMIVVAPDKGARERATACANALDCGIIYADKQRDPNNGKILGMSIDPEVARTGEPLGTQDLLMVDDICDGGRTFIELAKLLRPLTTGRILLYVTHGIFSQGLDVFEGLIDQIFCPNVFPNVKTTTILTKI